ncbi:prenyltransferase, UbiA family protein, putative [Babesia bigemina]|uniref:Protoheme IX farnesyltransferase, mitochondrial n=1 Tax=Babesia bigemina TaxID=5866 RepID=A0A061D8D2_BABBI|nr:prenyltransferase, UbiA family protein, putative [Babesia bigemina]CDR95174.1 prenyltransferase, UbiA family protein, putative [Babesia bigemina]|eukprot:XP_012767360.1 prenyltransferase, UbiA family protein, putative [Babesia bigemina]
MTSLSRALLDRRRNVSSPLSLFLKLSKWKLSLWVSATGASGFLMKTPALSPDFFYACGGVFLCSSAAHVFNQIMERKTDALMVRTRNRPLPTREITPRGAAVLGSASALAGSSLLWLTGDSVAAPLALMNVALYTCGYTVLKRYTEWNTHVGSIVGAIPPLIGYAAAGGSIMAPDPWMLFGMMYVWQLPHFYSLAWLHRKDYLNAGLKMFGTTDESGRSTALASVKWVTILTSMPMVYSYYGLISPSFAIVSLLPNLFVNYRCLRYLDNPCKEEARAFFLHSLWHVLMLVGLASYYVATENEDVKKKDRISSRSN